MSTPRFAVVDRNGTVVIHGMYGRTNAEQEAEELNRTGVPEGRPYTVLDRVTDR